MRAKARCGTGAERLRRGVEREACRRTIWWQPEGGAARAVAGAGEAFPATVFEQVHPAMGDRVRAFAVQQLGDVSGRRVWDLYAGIGETTPQLLERGRHGGERGVGPRARWRRPRPGARRRDAARGRVEDVLRRARPPDLVITNPPRTGMDERVTAELDRLAPSALVYVSCDPATLARDLQRLPRLPADRGPGVRSVSPDRPRRDRCGPGAAREVRRHCSDGQTSRWRWTASG